MPPANFTEIDHPLLRHKLTQLRKKTTMLAEFRRLMREATMLMAYEVTRDLALSTDRIETPIGAMDAPVLAGRRPCIVSILRAGNGMVDGMLSLMPNAMVGHIGIRRDEATLQPVEYYLRLPHRIGERTSILVDPMLATGGSAVYAMRRLKEEGATPVRYRCLVAAPEGVARVAEEQPDVPVFAASLDSHLDENGYIVPGLGDAGDRLFGTLN